MAPEGTPSAVDTGRRRLVAALAALAVPAFGATADAAPEGRGLLPLDTPGLDHLDVMVPDVEKSTRFYMGLFRTTLHAQPFQGAFRYFVLLGPLPENRAVGYLAVGNSRGRGRYIGHFCTSVVGYERNGPAIFAQMKTAFAKERFGDFPGATGVGGIFADPDGIEIQFLPSPDKLVPVATPSDLVPPGQGLVTPQRVDHCVLEVSDLQRAVTYYRVLYGRERKRSRDVATFAFRNGSYLELRQTRYVYGSAQTRIARYGIRVEPFDRAKVEAGIASLGGTVVGGKDGELHLKDTDGLDLALVSG
jgi:catechol 2,3-dioxygenase-like lactoylglutathione lyase family enzyme